MVNRGEEKVRVHMNVVPRVKLCAAAKTRQLLCGSSGDLGTQTSQFCRAGEFELICQRHFHHIHREDDKTCAHPSTWVNSHK